MKRLMNSVQFQDPVSHGQPEQLQMLMTPREILAKYQPLDADREDMEGEPYASSGTPAPVAMNTSGSNVRHGVYRGSEDTGGPYQASTYGTKWRGGEHTETDDELWDRKLDEASYDKFTRRRTPAAQSSGSSWAEYGGSAGTHTGTAEQFGGGYGTEPLAESIRKHGIEHPISLGTSGGHGTQGKREIVGGHHRLAVAFAHSPDQPIPVAHYKDIEEARHDPTRRYT